MPNKPSPDYLTRAEAVANRRLLAATTSRQRFVRAMALIAIRRHKGELEQANSGDAVTPVAVPPVGAHSGASTPPLSFDSRPDVARVGYHPLPDDLDPVTLPPEIPVIVGSAATPARRTGQRA